MKLEVLVATMGQTDMSLAEKMNLRQNAVVANQCGQWGYEERTEGFGRIRMLSTDTKGVGINRNLALQLAEADILLFADDDIRYYDGDLRGVTEAFYQLPDADVIFFGLDMTRNGEVYEERRNSVCRRRIWNSMRFGTCRMAVRRQSIEKKRIRFSTYFGGGCIYGSGEDTLFIRDCFHAGLHVYTHEYVLGACAKDSSSWFEGYNTKYFFDRGAMLACAFPVWKHVLKWYFAGKLCKKSGQSVMTIVRQMNNGIRAFGSLTPFGE